MKNDDIEVLDLDIRTYNALKRAGINTVEDVERQMAQLENLIPKTVEFVRDKLRDYKETESSVPVVPDT